MGTYDLSKVYKKLERRTYLLPSQYNKRTNWWELPKKIDNCFTRRR